MYGRRIVGLLVAVVIFVANGRPARADVSAGIEGALGMGTPTGWLGAEIFVAPIRPLVLHAGGGAGSQGFQLAAGTRFRMPLQKLDTFDMGASWSSGAFAGVPSTSFPIPEIGSANPLTFYWKRAHFLNFDVSHEAHFDRWALRSFFGIGYVIDGNDAISTNEPCHPASHSCSKTLARLVPYLGFAISFEVIR